MASKRDWDKLRKGVVPIYTAPNAAAARAALNDLTDRWGRQYRAIVCLWENAWNEFVPFLDYECPRSRGRHHRARGRGSRD